MSSDNLPLPALRLKCLVSFFVGSPRFVDGMGRCLVWRRLHEVEYVSLILRQTDASNHNLRVIFLVQLRDGCSEVPFDEEFFESTPSLKDLEKLQGLIKSARKVLSSRLDRARCEPDLDVVKGAFDAVQLVSDFDRPHDDLSVRLERALREGREDVPEFSDHALSFLKGCGIEEAGTYLRSRHLKTFNISLEAVERRPLVT